MTIAERKAMLRLYDKVAEILAGREQIVFIEFGACDGTQTKEITDILEGKCYLYYAFEPDERRIEGLRNHVGDRVSVIPAAIGAVDGKVTFYISGLNYYGSSSIRKPTPEMLRDFPKMTFDEGQVDSVRLDTFCRDKQIEHIDFIWADVQGAEVDLIEGGREMLAKTDYLYTEYNDGPMYEGCLGLKDILELLPGWSIVEDFGGDVFLKNENTNEGVF